MSFSKRFALSFPFLVFSLLVCSESAHAGPVRDLRLEAGRSFGHAMGDLIRHEIRFALDKPYRLEQDSLPRSGSLEKWLDLREIDIATIEQEHRTHYKIAVLYQIFPSIRESESRRIPGLPFRVYDENHSLTFNSPDTLITVSPLIPGYIPDAGITLRPAIKPAPIPVTAHWRILAALCAALIPVVGYAAWRRGLLPGLRSRRMPFAAARRELRRWRNAKASAPEYRNALLAIHRALNQTAGESIFAHGLEGFFKAHPAFAPMREKTGIFFRLSEQIFFTQTETLESAVYSVHWLEQLCREYHKIERSAG
ncbi:MAG: hypothetical protein L0Y43_02235 [Methylococcaceae bacterium]|nr:hypothetical protein [Methylococcaceae bacterium]